jgi:hypothetical protein
MNYMSVFLAGIGAFVAYFLFGALWTAFPAVRNEYGKHPVLFRPKEQIMTVMPLGMAAMLVAILALAALFALLPQPSTVAAGAGFGALIGLFAVGSFVIHNYVNLKIGAKLTLQQSAAYFVQWVLVGVVLAALYRA